MDPGHPAVAKQPGHPFQANVHPLHCDALLDISGHCASGPQESFPPPRDISSVCEDMAGMSVSELAGKLQARACKSWLDKLFTYLHKDLVCLSEDIQMRENSQKVHFNFLIIYTLILLLFVYVYIYI